MKVALINTSDVRGGAARAAYRLHKGFLKCAIDTNILVRHKLSSDEKVFRVVPENPVEMDVNYNSLNLIQKNYIDKNRTDISNTIFNLPYPGYDLSHLSIVHDADIINLHWIANYQSPHTIRKLIDLGKPVVWTLHDQWAFTGGCHYSAGCNNYKTNCSNCPQLANDTNSIAYAILRDKLDYFTGVNLTIVSPSKWLAECAKESKLFNEYRVETIPNSLETDYFTPLPKEEAKNKLGLSGDTITILFCAENGKVKRKGYNELVESLRVFSSSPKIQNLLSSNRIKLICFGQPNDNLFLLNIPTIPLGYLESDEEIRNAFCAADIYVLPSIEDNLPNTMLESMSCGTPVIAFDTGGMRDMIVDGKTGMLVPFRDTKNMGKAILDLVLNREKREGIGKNCRTLIENNYSLEVQAKNYSKLFQDLLGHKEVTRTNKLIKMLSMRITRRKREMIKVPLNCELGSNFQKIYKRCL